MRISKPSLVFSASPASTCVEPHDFIHEEMESITAQEAAVDSDNPFVNPSEIVSLPQNFGNIVLGETFSSYIAVHNGSGFVAGSVGIKTELQTSSQRVLLADTTMHPTNLEPKRNIDCVVHHEVKELGIHILVCSVHYTSPQEDRLFFRKFFKFQVSNPLAVKTKVYNVEDKIYLEAQVQNITQGPMYVENVSFDASPPFLYRDLNYVAPSSNIKDSRLVEHRPSTGDQQEESLTFGMLNYMHPQDIRQYLYELYLEEKNDRIVMNCTSIGKLDITWRTNLGEPGRLQTSQLPRKLPLSSELRISVTKIPEVIVVERAFNIECCITNLSERKMNLRLYSVKSKMNKVFMNGTSGQYIGEFPPDCIKGLNISLFPVVTGLQRVSGLRLVDLISGKTYDIDNLVDVLIVRY
eukprot:Nk52_evm1s2635 gene=Nk52_evmTU1s2635